MRTCKVFKPAPTGELILEGEAVFHVFSIGRHDYENGPGAEPVAVVEFGDGSLASRYVGHVRFDEPTRYASEAHIDALMNAHGTGQEEGVRDERERIREVLSSDKVDLYVREELSGCWRLATTDDIRKLLQP